MQGNILSAEEQTSLYLMISHINILHNRHLTSQHSILYIKILNIGKVNYILLCRKGQRRCNRIFFKNKICQFLTTYILQEQLPGIHRLFLKGPLVGPLLRKIDLEEGLELFLVEGQTLVTEQCFELGRICCNQLPKSSNIIHARLKLVYG